MGNDWDWNQKDNEREAEEVSASVQEETQENTPVTEETEENTVVQETTEEIIRPQEQTKEPETEEVKADTSYHWVNPEYQKRQEGAADAGENSYKNNAYRDTIGYTNEQNTSYGRNQNNPNMGYTTQPNGSGYQGGGYHEQNSFGAGPKTGERHYGAYQFAPESSRKHKEKKKNMGTGKRFLITAGMAVVFGVVAGGVMFGVNTLGNHLTGQDQKAESRVQVPTVEPPVKEESQSVSGAAVDNSGNYTVAQVADMCMPSVVSITNASVSTVRDFFGGIQEYPIESTGSGIIVGQNDSELLIATNNHVIAGAETLTVAFSDDAVYEAQIKGNNPDTDLAVIAVNLKDMSDETLNSIKIVSIGDSDSLKIGEQVVAIGNALGYGQSVTSGWVSAVNREVFDENGNSTGKLIQTDAAINPGNSGGALLNMKGELIGINSSKAAATEVEGMGYAIPVVTAQPILDELMNRETRYKVDEGKSAYIGVVCMDVDADAIAKYGIPKGAFVDSVEEGGPAEKAGIQKGDVIVKFDGVTISGKDDLVSKLEYYEAGEEVEVVISRAENGAYKEQTVIVNLGKRSEMTQTVPRR